MSEPPLHLGPWSPPATTSTVPVGTVMLFAKTSPGTPPDGYLLCGGQELNRGEYAALYAVIGTRYGTGDGSTTFNIPAIADHNSVFAYIKT